MERKSIGSVPTQTNHTQYLIELLFIVLLLVPVYPQVYIPDRKIRIETESFRTSPLQCTPSNKVTACTTSYRTSHHPRPSPPTPHTHTHTHTHTRHAELAHHLNIIPIQQVTHARTHALSYRFCYTRLRKDVCRRASTFSCLACESITGFAWQCKWVTRREGRGGGVLCVCVCVCVFAFTL